MTKSKPDEIATRLDEATTIENAMQWDDGRSEQFTFCLDLLDLSLVADGDQNCQRWVDRLEFRFEQLLDPRTAGSTVFEGGLDEQVHV